MARTFSAIIVALFCAAATAFVNNGAARSMVKAASLNMKMDISKFAAIVPAAIATPAFASVDALNTMPVSLEVTFAAYLAVLLGTFFPVVFLVTLYFQSESRKAGIKDGSKGLN